jgi:adenylyltransferase/sulfurtransferase
MTAAPPPAEPGRYDRQARFAGIGNAGQQRLRGAHVLVVGVGALGSHVADALARAGVGRLTLVDRDIVELHNLQRQVLFDEQDAAQARPKALAAAARLAAVNRDVEIVPIVAQFDAALFEHLQPAPDLILDGTDNFPTRYLINDLAVRAGRPWIYGGVVGAEGTAMTILPGRTPCLRCVFPHAPPGGEVANCETAGVLAPAVAIVAAFEVAEALKLLTGNAARITPGVQVLDVWNLRFATMLVARAPDPDCPTCGRREFPALLSEPARCTSLCGRNAVQVLPPRGTEIDLARLAHNLRPVVRDLEASAHALRFDADGHRFHVFAGGRAIVFGTGELDRARALYDRWIG